MKFYFCALKCGLVFLILLAGTLAVSHESERKSKNLEGKDPAMLAQINDSYIKTVKPIFQKSCFDCHGPSTNYPWYSKIPGVKQLIAGDITEAHEHLDMDEDFPFGSHASPTEDLEAIEKTISDGSMPPFRYRIMHQRNALTNAEKEQVHQWIKFGKDMVKEK